MKMRWGCSQRLTRSRYTIPKNLNGWTAKSFTKLYVTYTLGSTDNPSFMDTKLTNNSGITLGAFGGVAGFFALFFLSGVPRVKRDILQVRQHSQILGTSGS
jgi:hypothetical protein